MPSATVDAESLRFGPAQRFELRLAQRQLTADGTALPLGSRAFDLLSVLIAHRDRVVSKNELLDLVWPSTVVEESNLHVQVSTLRKLLGHAAIATVPGRGYRFVADVAAAPPPPAAAFAAAPVAADAAPVPSPGALHTNLPDGLSPLIGRAEDLAALEGMVEAHSLVTLIGPGGVGKTRLAQALLQRLPGSQTHGVCWVELAPVTDAQALPSAVAAALGIRGGSGAALPALVAALEPLAVLIALDNAEHLIAAVAELAQAVHRGAPRARLLVTSQIPLKIADEQLYRLGALDLPDPDAGADAALRHGAVALFVDRVRAIDRRFALDADNVAAAVQVCRRLDGMALAIELAAARVPLLGLPQLAAALDQRLRLLTTGQRGAPQRQQTLRAALAWSVGFLDAAELRVFRRLGVFVGSATLDAVRQVAADPPGTADGLDEWDVLEALAVLVERSLVSVNDAPDPRYRLLESPRALALEHLDAAGERALLQRRHAEAFARRFEAAYPARWDGSCGVREWSERLKPDLDNARDAYAWARLHDPASALRIAVTLLWALPISLWSERMALCDSAEALLAPELPDLPELLCARVWLAIAHARMRTRNRQGMAAAGAAAALFRRLGDVQGRWLALAGFVDAAARANAVDAAAEAVAELHALRDPAWPPHILLPAAEGEALLAMRRGDRVLNLHLRHQALALQRAAGDDDAVNVGNLIDAELTAGLVDDAVRDGQALVAQLEGTRHERELTFARLNLLAAALCAGNLALARSAGEAGWRQAARFELQPYFADHLALLCALEQRPRAAARLIGYADAGHARMDDPREPNEAAAWQRAQALVAAALDADELARLRAAGGLLRDDAVPGLSFGADDGR